MATVLTAQSVLRIKPDPSRRVEVPDAIVPGLYFVVQPSGVKSWAVRFRHRGEPRKLTIGRFGVFDLVTARDEARKALQAVAAGRDPCFDKREARRAVAADPGRDLVSTHVEVFLARYVRPQTKARTAAETERRLRKYVLPAWGERRVREITRRDVIELLDGIVDVGAPITANRTLTTLKTFFGWLVDRSVIEVSPCARVKAPAPETSRDRVLNDDELRALWRASESLGGAYGGFARFLLLTAQRRDEVAGLRRSELKGDLWTIPAERTKGGAAHDVPLSQPARCVLDEAPANGRADYVFTVTGETPINGYSGAKRKLDAALPAMPHWTFHDLRRTAASGMARLGIPVNVIEAVLAHRGGEVSGVSAVYNRHSYLPEKRRALDAWAAHIMGLVGEPAASNVVPLRA
jgi:integrase